MAWTAPRTWVAAEVVTASNMNTHVRDNLKAIGDAWTTYTPTWTNLTVGNGTVLAQYVAAGKLIICQVGIVWGSTTSVSGSITVSLPFNRLNSTIREAGGQALYYDTSASDRRSGSIELNGSANLVFYVGNGTVGQTQNVNATVPFTWATGDTMMSPAFAYQST
jgi:hypothetical protein